MPNYWGKQIFTHGSCPELGQKQKMEKKKKILEGLRVAQAAVTEKSRKIQNIGGNKFSHMGEVGQKQKTEKTPGTAGPKNHLFFLK